MKLNITLLIPLLLVISTMFASILIYIKHDLEAGKNIRKEALSHMKLDITRLQNILYNLLTERADNIEEARLNLSVTAMGQSMQILLLTGEDHSVIMANRYSWENVHASTISMYDTNTAKKVVERNSPETIFQGEDEELLTGYYPVVLKLEDEHGLPVKRMGLLYTEVSMSNKLAYAKNEATILSMTLAVLMLIVAGIVALLLHFRISVRLTQLTSAVERFSWGDLDSSTSIGGNDELTVVGDAFNEMARHIKQDIWRREKVEYNLKNMTKILEQRVKERTEELEVKKQELLDAQAVAHHSNKMEALGEMASGIAHEINSPLQVISILTYKIKKLDPKSETKEIEESTDKIDQATELITNIVESLRKISRDSSSDPLENVKIIDIINDVVHISTERYKLKNIKLNINYHAQSEFTSLDCQRLQIAQIIINLLNNAYDAVLEQTERWIAINIFDDDNCIVITVTDNGSGIKKQDREHIFSPMFTTKDIGKGTGLGLSISREITHQHGGTLILDTNSENTCFKLTVPKHPSDKNDCIRDEDNE